MSTTFIPTTADVPTMPARPGTGLSALERFLCLFTEVRAGEGVTAVVMFADVFLVLCAYYFLKPLRDGWIAGSDVWGLSKMEVKAYTSFAQSVILIGVVALYAHFAARWPRRTLIVRSTLFCMSNALVFWFLRPGARFGQGPLTGIVFYIWVGMFGVFVVAQFWAFAADLYTNERGRRILPLIAIGATAGAAAGAYLAGVAVDAGLLDSGVLMLGANVALAASLALTAIADTRGPADGTARPVRRPAAATGATESSGDAFAMVMRRRYLIAVAAVVLLTHWVNTNGENILFQVVQDALQHDLGAQPAADPAAASAFIRAGTTAFYGSFFFWVNVCALGLQALVASRLLKYGGLGAILLLLPTIALLGASAMAFLPVLVVVQVMKTAENAVNYSINNTAQQVLWLPTTAAEKYTAKPAVETFCVRLGDGMAAFTVLLGAHVLVFTTRSFLLTNVVLCVAWLLLAVVVVRENRRAVAAG
jgi:ATP:ADP antiporter, AAA family